MALFTNEGQYLIGKGIVTIKENGEGIFTANVLVIKVRSFPVHPRNEHIFIPAEGSMVATNL